MVFQQCIYRESLSAGDKIESFKEATLTAVNASGSYAQVVINLTDSKQNQSDHVGRTIDTDWQPDLKRQVKDTKLVASNTAYAKLLVLKRPCGSFLFLCAILMYH